MCGIAGLVYSNQDRPIDESVLIAMRDSMIHRGPDGCGVFIDRNVGLAHRRLSIIDLASGQQPMSTDDGRYTISFNGEIYNYLDLKKELLSRGVQFHTSSDTEVALKWFAQFGASGIAQFNGMFALAIWDKAERKLTLTRDRLGIKPLYYHYTADHFVFGSEVKALLQSNVIDARLNESAVFEYFCFRQVAGEDNLFQDITTLLPGHTLTWQDGEISVSRYFQIQRDIIENISFPDAADELDSLLQKSVQSQLMSDVPLGTFCSGGIDSSLVTALASNAKGSEINTFSVGFHEADFDESEYARKVSSAYHTSHHEIKLDADEYCSLLPELIWKNDLPLNFANSVHIYALSKLAREHVTVVLTGEGADELFGGYPRYYIPKILKPSLWVQDSIRNFVGNLLQKVPDHRISKLGSNLTLSLKEIILLNSASTGKTDAEHLYIKDINSFKFREEQIDRNFKLKLDEVSNLSILDQLTYLVSILNRQDKMSMAASIEGRVPFLDNEVIDFANSLPLKYKLTFADRKKVLKAVARRYLGNDIVDRQKSGFGVPLNLWMKQKGPLNESVQRLLSSRGITDLFNKELLANIISEHERSIADHSEFLWSAINFMIWREKYNL